MSTTDPRPVPDASGSVSPPTASVPDPDSYLRYPGRGHVAATRVLWTWALTTAVLVAAASWVERRAVLRLLLATEESES